MFPMETGLMFLCPVSVGNTNSVSARNITRNRSSGSKNVSYRNRTHVSNGSRFGNRSPVSSPVSKLETDMETGLMFLKLFPLEKGLMFLWETFLEPELLFPAMFPAETEVLFLMETGQT